MTIVQEGIKSIRAILPEQNFDYNTQYRLSSFCILTSVEDQFLVYNTLTGEVVAIDSEEKKLFTQLEHIGEDRIKPFVEKHFFVPLAHDDIVLADEIFEFAKLFEKSDGYITYTIFTTMDCNARCFYCYEMGRPRTPMSEQTAHDVVEFISKTCNKDKKIKLSWFGGEPLYNSEVIDIITRGLREKGIAFVSRIISNGYLFDDKRVKTAVEQWNLKNVQISLDGTEEVYNRSKAFIYSGESSFKVVTDNIERLLKANVHVAIRLNVGEHNKEDILQLVEWIAERYADYKDLYVYAHLLFEYDDNKVKGAIRSSLADSMLEVEKRCQELGLRRGGTVKKDVAINSCIADSSSAITINTAGKLGKCEHFSEDEFVGDIYNGITDFKKIEEFKVGGKSKELCAQCPAYPVCIKIKKCPDIGGNVCNEASKKIKLAHLEIQAQNTYRRFKEQQKNKAE